jgi:hypothetical protein
MTGDCHVRFCERLRGETPLCLLGALSADRQALRENPPRRTSNSAGQASAADP